MQAWIIVMDHRKPAPPDQWKYGLFMGSHWNAELENVKTIYELPFASVSERCFG